MVTSFRLVADDGGSIGEAGTIDEAIELARTAEPGRYRILEMRLSPGTGELRSFEWGAITTRDDGVVELDPPPWID